MDVTSFCTYIPQEGGIQIVCEAYDTFYKDTRLIAQALRLILQENSFQFCDKNYLQTHGTAMGTKMGVAFANQIFMGKVQMAKAHSNLSFGNDISTTFFPSGTPTGSF